jgi:multiple sugar transport system ATP-binding protein
MAVVELNHVTKRFETSELNLADAVKDFSLTVADGEFLVLVGPSGCGKSTVLRMIAGLEEITAGEVRIDGLWVNNLPPRDRDIAMVFQSYALYPHMTVAENIGFSLKIQHMDHEEIDRRVRETARLLELETLLDRRPKNLSGGQRQRVAMGRAIVREPKVFLMDEPLSNLDAKLRVQMRNDIAEIQERLGITTIYVTHDQIEAMTMADRVAVMRKGTLQQVDKPQTVYERPINLFVAAFIGSPPMNLLEGHLKPAEHGGATLVLGGQQLTLSSSIVDQQGGLRDAISSGVAIAVGIRPEDLEDANLLPGDRDQQLEIAVRRVAALGAEVEIHFDLDAAPIATEEARLAKGESIEDAPHKSSTTCIASLNPRTTIQAGDVVLLTVDVSRMHFFDLATGQRI